MTQSAILKIYTDNAHTSEVPHTTIHATTLNNGGTLAIGATALTLASAVGWSTSGMVDIDTGGNMETIPYFGLSGNVIQLSSPTAISHADAVTIVSWFYLLPVGDQVNGIANDGTNATPHGTTNVGTWYVYNSGGQTATSPVFSTSNASPSTGQGYSDTLISITSISSGFATSVTPANIAAGSQQQIWIVAEIPNAQNPAGTNPQVCVININYNSI